MKLTERQKASFASGVLLIVCFCAMYYWSHSGTQPHFIHEEGRVHGTFYHIVYEAKDGKSLQNEYEDGFRRFDMSLSTFEPKSIISRINQNDTTVVADSLFVNVFNTAQAVTKKTHGAFDMTVAPLVNAWGFGFKKGKDVTEEKVSQLLRHVGCSKVTIGCDMRVVKSDTATMLDASAIAKGYSSDVVANTLRSHGVENFMVEIGGECVVSGHNEKGRPWAIGISKPVDDTTMKDDGMQALVAISKGAIATSGNYRQFYYKDGKKYAHTIDPRTGRPVSHSLLSATVYAPDCMHADAYATACMVLGADSALALIEGLDGFECYLISSPDDGSKGYKTTCSKGFPFKN